MKFYSLVLILFLLVAVYGKIRKLRTSLNTESTKTQEALQESSKLIIVYLNSKTLYKSPILS